MKTQALRVTTPIGVAVWPRLNTPDREFVAEGEFKVDLLLDPSEGEVSAFLDKLQKYADDAYKAICKEKSKKVKRSVFPWKEEQDRETGEPTGKILLRCKMKHQVRPKHSDPFTQSPKLFDAMGNPMDAVISGGSKLKLSLDVVPYYTASIGAGVTCRLKAAQVIELVEYSGADSAATHGFTAIEGGYEAPEPAPVETFEESAAVAARSEDLEDY